MVDDAWPRDVLGFWFEELKPVDWFRSSDETDASIAGRFGDLPNRVAELPFDELLVNAETALAALIVLDQFPRNMFRGTALAFSSDACALSIANRAIAQGFDMETDEPQRQFFYLPHMHSESLTQQERGVRLIRERMSEQSTNLLHARAHREVIRRFGRFPFRNEALGRDASPAEESYISEGGYGATVRSLQS